MPNLPYLLLSVSIDNNHADAIKVRNALRTALDQRTHAWVIKNDTAVVQIPTMTVLDEVLADMTNIEEAFDPAFTCVAVFVPHKQLYWVSEEMDDPPGVRAITGRPPFVPE